MLYRICYATVRALKTNYYNYRIDDRLYPFRAKLLLADSSSSCRREKVGIPLEEVAPFCRQPRTAHLGVGYSTEWLFADFTSPRTRLLRRLSVP